MISVGEPPVKGMRPVASSKSTTPSEKRSVRLSTEPDGHTLQPTALVHEAYLRLIGPADAAKWDDRGHLFAAAAEAMRRILVDHARKKHREKRGGGRRRVELAEHHQAITPTPDEVLDLDEALTRFAEEDAGAARIVTLPVAVVSSAPSVSSFQMMIAPLFLNACEASIIGTTIERKLSPWAI